MSDNNIEMHMPENTPKIPQKHLGLILGVLVIALAFIFGGLFLWGSKLGEETPKIPEQPITNNEPETPRAVADQKLLETTSSSDELDAIDADLSSTNLDSLDTDITAIDAELNAAPAQQ